MWNIWYTMPVKDCLAPIGHNLQVETPYSNPWAVGEHSSWEAEKHVDPVVSTESLCYWCKYINCLLKQEVLVSLRCTHHVLLCFFFTVQACWSSLCGWRWHWTSCLHSKGWDGRRVPSYLVDAGLGLNPELWAPRGSAYPLSHSPAPLPISAFVCGCWGNG